MSPLSQLTVAGLAGVSLHLTLFKQGEWERYSPMIAQFFLLVELALYLLVWTVQQFIFFKALLDWALLNIGFGVGIFGSIALYRIAFHPLRAYPGPWGANLTSFLSVKWAASGFQLQKKLFDIHRKHGDFVRIRPREISINNAKAVRNIHGPTSKCAKGPFYDLNYPSRSLQMTRDRYFHSKRKRVWEKGLSPTGTFHLFIWVCTETDAVSH